MARGRILSPLFWSDSKIVKLSPFARLFYQGMWNFAYCDKGHVVDDADDLKLKILPADPVDAHALLEEIMGSDRAVRREVDGQSYLFMPTFEKNQSASSDARWKSRCPICKLLEPLETSGEFPKTLGTTRGRGEERRGVEGRGTAPEVRPPRFCPKHPTGTDGGCFACRDARLAQQEWDEAQKKRPTPSPADRRLRPHECPHKKIIDGCCNECGERVRN